MGFGSIMDALGIGEPADPVFENLPRSVRSFQNKYAFQGDYAPLASIIPALPEDVRSTLIQHDQERVTRGAAVVPAADTIAAISTLITGQPYTKPPKNPNPITDLPSAIFRDVRDIARNVPKMPLQLIKEAQNVGRFASEYEDALERTGNPLAALAASPGIRMLPGAYAVENIAGGTPGELLRHPVFAALDVAPFAAKGAKAASRTPAVQQRLETLRGSEPYRRLASSNIAVKTRETFGTQAREASYMWNTGAAQLGDWYDPTRAVDNALEVTDAQKFTELTLAKATAQLKDKYAQITPERERVLKQSAELDDPLPDMDDLERGYVNDYKDLQSQWQAYSLTRQDVTDSIREVYDPRTGSAEVFPRRQAVLIQASRSKAQYHRDVADMRTYAQQGANPYEILERVKPYLGTDLVADVTRRRQMINAGAGALRGLGLADEARSLERVATDLFQKKEVDTAMTRFEAIYDRTNPAHVDPASREAILERITNLNDPKLAKAATLVQARAWAPARRAVLDRLKVTKGGAEGELREIADQIRTARQTEKFLDQTAEFTNKRAAILERQAERRFQRFVPARYQPLVKKAEQDELVGALRGETTIKRGRKDELDLSGLPDDVRERLVNDVIERNYTNLAEAGITTQDIRRIQREKQATWQEMKEAGLNPVYVHRANPDVAHVMNFPTFKASIQTPSQVKARTMDVTPHYDNLTIALNHQALEWLTRRAVKDFTDNVASKWAVGHNELYNRYVPFARQRHALRPDLDVNAHVNKLMQREWTKFDPTAKFPWMTGRSTGMPKEDVYVPKVVANTIDRFFNDNPGLFSQASAPIMNAFRTSVLTLSPRWHVYNILGGMVMLMARTDPLTVWKHLGAARQMLQTGEIPELLRGELGKARLVQQELAYSRGIKGQEFLNQAKAKIPGGEKAAGAFNKVTDASWRFNQWVDDMYRAMSYLYGYDKNITKGMTKDQAVKAGVELSRKIMPDWNSMTPIERNVIRSVFPFYGFMSHVLRYVMKYPIDHPIRASVISNFARAEMEDMEEATPTKFADIFAFGDVDEKGDRKAFSFAGLNPFSGVTDVFTMAGFLSQVNPLLATALEQVGLVQGRMDMNPDVRYDPDTGRLALQSPNPIANLFANTIPQVSLFTQLANPTSELNRMRARDPEIGETIIRGALGVPRLFVKFNENEEQLKGELQRREAVNRARAEALKSGIDTQARRYPQLASYLTQLRQLQESNPDVFTAYAPGTYSAELGIEQTAGVTAIGQAQRILLGSLAG